MGSSYEPDQVYGFMIYTTARNLHQHLSIALRHYGLTPEQWNILSHIGEEEGVNQKALAQKSNKDQASITRIIEILLRNEWIKRKKNPEDKREYFIYLTEEGADLRKKLIPLEKEAMESLIEDLSEADLEAMAYGLRKINQNYHRIHEAKEDNRQ